MNILFISSAFPSENHPNSGIHNFRTISEINKINSVTVLHLRSWKPWRKIIKKENYNGILCFRFSFPLYINLPLIFLSINLYLYRFILYLYIKNKLSNFNIIHSAGISMESVIASYLSKKSKLKHIAQVMGGDININLPIMSHKYFWKGFESNVNIFVCNSKNMIQKVHDIYPKSKVTYIYRGIDISLYKFCPLQHSNLSLIHFLFLGGLISNAISKYETLNLKGGLTLLRAWKYLIEKKLINQDTAMLTFSGPNVTMPLVKNELNCNPEIYNIVVINQIENSRIANFISSSSIVVVPSFEEGLPNVAVEAAAIGRPVIASNTGGIPEIVRHNHTGILFEPGNIMELATCMLHYINNKHLIIEHGNNARFLVEQNFNSNDCISKYNKLYHSIKQDHY